MRSNVPRIVLTLLLLCFAAAGSFAQTQTPSTEPTAAVSDTTAADQTSPTIFRHDDSRPYLVLGQVNIVFQAHAPFHSPYQDTNSLLSRGEYKTSVLGTLYLGYQLNRNPRFATDVILDTEDTGGRGISEALGLAGFTNLDVVRNPNLGSAPYLARYEIHQVLGLTRELAASPRTPVSLATQLPVRRVERYVGRMSIPGFLDTNSVGTDSHLQFLNWTVTTTARGTTRPTRAATRTR